MNLRKDSKIFFNFFRVVIHPHVPVGIPCYDFTPITVFPLNLTSKSSGNRSSHGMTGGVCKEQGHIHGGVADPPLLAIPTSCSRVPDYNLNWGRLWGFAPSHDIASLCTAHCIVSVALGIKGMRTWRHPLLPPSYLSSLVRHPN